MSCARPATPQPPGQDLGSLADERGVVSLVVVVLMAAIVTAAGLTYDGGQLLAAKIQTQDQAAEAARAGAQALSAADRTTDTANLDPTAAAAAAHTYLASTGHDATVTVNGPQVTVTVTWTKPLTILRIAGNNTARITETATATATPGVIAKDLGFENTEGSGIGNPSMGAAG